MIPLSVLDLSPVSAGSTGAQALRNSLDLARLADQLGFVRYWVAEHHSMPAIASSAPDIMIGQIAFLPNLLPPVVGMLVVGIASGAAMIPYTIIKEANPDEVKGSATGTINFLNFGISALIGPVFGGVLGRTLETTSDAFGHFRHAGLFWMVAVLLAIVMSFFLHETGHRRVAQPGPTRA